MSQPLRNGTIVGQQYEIVRQVGWRGGQGLYAAEALTGEGELLVCESPEIFRLAERPPGVVAYFEEGGKHYLVLRLSGHSLDFVLAMAGQIEEVLAGLWILQIARALGYWHMTENKPLVCLQHGRLSLSDFRLSEVDLVMVPAFETLCAGAAGGSADGLSFGAPETDREEISPRSDVYALGAMLYTLLAGTPPPEPELLQARSARLIPLRRARPGISRDMDKVVTKALAQDPRRRYADGGEMADALERFLIPLAREPQVTEPKPSLLARAAPFLVSLALLGCLGVIVEGVVNRPRIELPWWLKAPPTPTYTPAPFATATDTPTPRPTSTPMPTATATPIPLAQLVLNQVRTDGFPRMIVYSSALDQGQEPIRELPHELFRIVQDGQDVTEFDVGSVDAATDPIAMVVAMDISGSMQGEPMQKARAAASNFVGRFDTGDRVCLVKFDDRIELVQDFATDKDLVIGAIGELRTRGDTALYDVIAYSIERLTTQTGRRAVVVLTDGRDTASVDHGLESAIAAANDAGMPVFVLGLDSPQFTPAVMNDIADGTGGSYLFAPAPDDLDALYQKIRGQLQNQYRIEFVSLHGPDGEGHVLRIGLTLPDGREMWSEKEYRSP